MVLKRQATTPPDPSGSPWPVAGSGAAVPLKAGNGEQKKSQSVGFHALAIGRCGEVWPNAKQARKKQ
jgi:hypothetical protein